MRKYHKGFTPPRSLLGFSSNKLGFTLIELLVVITVIGVLAAIVLIAINPAQQAARARDAGRKSDLRQIANALEQYRVFNGQYPDPVPGGQGCWASWESGSVLNGANDPFLQILVGPSYMKKVPIETKPIVTDNLTPTGPEPDADGWGDFSECSYRYMREVNHCGSGQTFAVLYTFLETDSGKEDIQPPIFRDPGPSCWWWEGNPDSPEVDKYDWVIFLPE